MRPLHELSVLSFEYSFCKCLFVVNCFIFKIGQNAFGELVLQIKSMKFRKTNVIFNEIFSRGKISANNGRCKMI